MQGTDQFQNVIQSHLVSVAREDESFAKKLENPKKSIAECCTYIINTVHKSGKQGFADSEIFGMATHYYDEDKIEVGKSMNAQVIVNHSIDKPVVHKSKTVQKPKAKRSSTITEPFEQLSMF